jgi:hypothetical protein
MQQFLADPRDSATPEGTIHLLVRASRGELLSLGSTNYLFEVMEATRTGKGRLKGVLPPNTPVAHKTPTQSKDSTAQRMMLESSCHEWGTKLPLPCTSKEALEMRQDGTASLQESQKQLTRGGQSSFVAGPVATSSVVTVLFASRISEANPHTLSAIPRIRRELQE